MINYIKQHSHKEKFCFIHIPKTGGISIRNLLSQMLSGYRLFPAHTLPEFKKRENELKLVDSDLYFGHVQYHFINKFLGNKVRYMTILRSPVDRVLSLYNYWQEKTDDFMNSHNVPERLKKGPRRAKQQSLEDFLLDETNRSTISDVQARFLATSSKKWKIPEDLADNALENLKGFSLVGVLELLPLFVKELAIIFNIDTK